MVTEPVPKIDHKQLNSETNILTGKYILMPLKSYSYATKRNRETKIIVYPVYTSFKVANYTA